MMEACRSNGLLAEDGTDQCLATIKSGLEKGKSQPKGIPERTADILYLPNAKLPEQQPAPLTAIHATPYVCGIPPPSGGASGFTAGYCYVSSCQPPFLLVAPESRP